MTIWTFLTCQNYMIEMQGQTNILLQVLYFSHSYCCLVHLPNFGSSGSCCQEQWLRVSWLVLHTTHICSMQQSTTLQLVRQVSAHKSRQRERCQPEMKREKPITVKGLLDNGSRLSPPNNDDYMEREQELTSTGTVYLIS